MGKNILVFLLLQCLFCYSVNAQTTKDRCETGWASCSNKFTTGWGSYASLTSSQPQVNGNIMAGQHYNIGTFNFKYLTNGKVEIKYSITDNGWGVQSDLTSLKGTVHMYAGKTIPKLSPGSFTLKPSLVAGTRSGTYILSTGCSSSSACPLIYAALHLEVCYHAPTQSPTKKPTLSPTKSPTKNPTESPTKSPTQSPTKSPTNSPTENPTQSPTKMAPATQCETAWAAGKVKFTSGWGSYSPISSNILPATISGSIFAGQNYNIGTYTITYNTNGSVTNQFKITASGWRIQSDFTSTGIVHIYAGSTVPGSNPGSYTLKPILPAGTASGVFTIPSSDTNCGIGNICNPIYVAIHLTVCR